MFNPISNQSSYYAPKAPTNKVPNSPTDNKPEKIVNKNNPMQSVVQTERISPQQAADNILQHVAQGISALRQAGGSEQAIAERLEQAKAGIEKGYKEAEEILKSMGLMTDELAQSIQQGRELVDKGVEALASNQPLPSKEVMQAESYSGEASMQLEMRTQEGDIVNINFNQINEYSSMQYASENNGMSRYASEMSAYSETSWQFSVQGDLNQQEVDALNKVIKGVQKLGAAFFSGDLSSALEQASQLGLGSTALASLSLNLQQNEQYQATSAYQTNKASALPDSLQGFAGRLAGFGEQLEDTFKAAQPLAEPQQVIKGLTEQMWQKEPETPSLLGFIDDFAEQFKTLLG